MPATTHWRSSRSWTYYLTRCSLRGPTRYTRACRHSHHATLTSAYSSSSGRSTTTIEPCRAGRRKYASRRYTSHATWSSLRGASTRLTRCWACSRSSSSCWALTMPTMTSSWGCLPPSSTCWRTCASTTRRSAAARTFCLSGVAPLTRMRCRSRLRVSPASTKRLSLWLSVRAIRSMQSC